MRRTNGQSGKQRNEEEEEKEEIVFCDAFVHMCLSIDRAMATSSIWQRLWWWHRRSQIPIKTEAYADANKVFNSICCARQQTKEFPKMWKIYGNSTVCGAKRKQFHRKSFNIHLKLTPTNIDTQAQTYTLIYQRNGREFRVWKNESTYLLCIFRRHRHHHQRHIHVLFSLLLVLCAFRANINNKQLNRVLCVLRVEKIVTKKTRICEWATREGKNNTKTVIGTRARKWFAKMGNDEKRFCCGAKEARQSKIDRERNAFTTRELLKKKMVNKHTARAYTQIHTITVRHKHESNEYLAFRFSSMFLSVFATIFLTSLSSSPCVDIALFTRWDEIRRSREQSRSRTYCWRTSIHSTTATKYIRINMLTRRFNNLHNDVELLSIATSSLTSLDFSRIDDDDDASLASHCHTGERTCARARFDESSK